ncbi:MAG TPA: transketolase, partial [Geminicoccaceae bacterium]|nr:transketolase [Geminicoccaceae bacterium]
MSQRVRARGEGRRRGGIDPKRLAVLGALERKVLWLACWTIHNANHVRPSRDGLKVGGHQASCASVATLMTALYFDVLRPNDRVAVKPHASPVFHAIRYLLGKESRERLERFRALGGAQAYPSRTKDAGGVDFSTGSVGLGVAMTLFASLTQDLIRLQEPEAEHGPEGRMVAIVGDAELDEGNVWEALLEGWKHDVRNLWWVIDYNRQSLDRVVPERLWSKIEDFFTAVGWNVVTIKYGKRLQAAFRRPGGGELRRWIDACPNDLYSALTFKGGPAWREHLELDLGHVPGMRELLADHDDDALARLMTNLGGHDLEAVLEAFRAADGDDRPHCFLAYTIKGFGLPFAGHKDNHAGLMTPEQMARFRAAHAVPEGREWDPFAGLDDPRPEELRAFLADVPFAERHEVRPSARVAVPAALPRGRTGARGSTQEAFGRIMAELARDGGELSGRIVTASPDVTVSTSLGG